MTDRQHTPEVREAEAVTERQACGDYQHEGIPSEDDRPCTRCDGTGWIDGPEGPSTLDERITRERGAGGRY